MVGLRHLAPMNFYDFVVYELPHGLIRADSGRVDHLGGRWSHPLFVPWPGSLLSFQAQTVEMVWKRKQRRLQSKSRGRESTFLDKSKGEQLAGVPCPNSMSHVCPFT